MKKGTKSLVTDDSSSNNSQSGLLKQQIEENHKREIEEMRKKFSKLPTSTSQLTTLPLPLEVT